MKEMFDTYGAAEEYINATPKLRKRTAERTPRGSGNIWDIRGGVAGLYTWQAQTEKAPFVPICAPS